MVPAGSKTLAVPDGPEAITTEWLSAALHAGGALRNGRVKSSQVEGLGQGMAGRVARVLLTYEGDVAGAPATLVAKFPAAPGSTRQLADLLHLYEREERFYQQLSQRLPLPVPLLYYGASERDNFVLLLEDVAGAREGNLLSGSSLIEAAAVVERLARMHAAWWGATALGDLGWLPAPNDDSVTELGSSRGSEAWRAFHRKFGAHMPHDISALGAWLARDRTVVDRLSASPQTLVHGDMRVNNVLFSDGEPRAFIDWQTAVRGRGPIDVANLFVSSLQPGDRRAAESDLLPRYHRLLVEGGVQDYSFVQCWIDYRLAVINQFSQVVVLSSLLDVETRLEDGVGAVTGGRLIAALLDLRAPELVVPVIRWKRWLSRLAPRTSRG
ncbi:MAG: phosphotransferase [Chloroflexi bacterium]|nr:phosphotransferase [Chloroflexota bacterium]